MRALLGYHKDCGGNVRTWYYNSRYHQVCSKCGFMNVRDTDIISERQVFKIQRTCGVPRRKSRRTTDARSWKELAHLVKSKP